MLNIAKGLRAEQGIRVIADTEHGAFSVNIDTGQLSDAERNALGQLLRDGKSARIDREAATLLEGRRLSITDASDGPICRFDLKCVKINKADSIDLLELVARS